jgi:hypothetical protein
VNANARLVLSLAIVLSCSGAALAQSTPAVAGDPGAPPVPRVRSSSGVEYINGGAGEETRAAIDAQRGEFPLRLVFSVAGGAYVVADHVDVSNGQGRVLAVDNAGPMLLVRVPPGAYTVDATYGGKTERRSVRVGRDTATINWRWPDEVRR